MSCSERDQDILLLQHGELTGWRKLATLHHLRTCPRCQEKHDQLAQTARHIAGAIRQVGALPPFQFPPVPTLAKTTPTFADTRRPLYRPYVIASVSAFAAISAAGAFVYKSIYLAPPPADPMAVGRVIEGRTGLGSRPGHKTTLKKCLPPIDTAATDASGKPTIFPYSTPIMNDHHDKL